MEGAIDPHPDMEDSLFLSLLDLKGGAGPAHFQEGVIPIIRRFQHIALLLHHISASSHQLGVQKHIMTFPSAPFLPPSIAQAPSLPSSPESQLYLESQHGFAAESSASV